MRAEENSGDIAGVLYKAAEYMSEHGKTDHVYEDDEGRVCALGAIGRAENKMKWCEGFEEGYWKPLPSVAAQAFEWWCYQRKRDAVIAWSDASSAEDVILGLKQCAHDLENGTYNVA